MIVCGLDPSLTSTGIAILRDGIPVTLTSLGHSGRDADTYLMRSRRIVSQTRAVINAIGMAVTPVKGLTSPDELILSDWRQIDLVVIEGPSYGSQWGDQWDRAALWWGLYSSLTAKRIPIAVVSPKTRAKWATGKDVEGNGNSKKPAVFAAIKEEWTDVRQHIRNDDIADALVMAAMGAAHLGDPLPIQVHQWRVNGLTAVQWPVKA